MLADNDLEKEKISTAQYGDLITNCGFTAIGLGVASSFLGFISIPATLTYLDRFIVSRVEFKFGTAIIGALFIGLSTAKHVRINCEKKLLEKYKI